MPLSTRLQRVLAGPGSGKTRLVVEEVRQRVEQGAPLDSLLTITFTRRAAKEMRDRLTTSLGAHRLPWIGTFHQLARRLQVDLKALPDVIVLDRLIPDAIRLLKQRRVPDWIGSLKFIAVDEAQDLDQDQITFLTEMHLGTTACNLLLVGDPDQAIYSFRGASSRFLLYPQEHFQEACTTRWLSTNHRSAQPIVAMAQAILTGTADPQAPCHRLVAGRPEAHPAIRYHAATSVATETTHIFEEVRTLLALGIEPSQIAILVRTKAQMEPLRAEAARWSIPIFTPPLQDQLETGQERPTPPQEAITLLTIHQAKGGEWTAVFLAGCQRGLLPHAYARSSAQVQEERQLLYVAVTRARQLLWISWHTQPSPFLDPFLSTRTPFSMTPRSPGPRQSPTTRKEATPVTRVSLWARLTSLFK